jgi:hypothetical protein
LGSLSYPVRGTYPVSIDDRTLAHLQVVIGSKLRLRQSFFFNWIDDLGTGGGRTSIWIDSTIQLTFTYTANERHHINRAWLGALMESANSAQGLQLVSEPLSIAA